MIYKHMRRCINTCKTVIGVFSNENSTLDGLGEYPFDGLLKHRDLFRDVWVDRVHKRVDTFHRSYEVDQFLVRSDLVSNDLHDKLAGFECGCRCQGPAHLIHR
jgi:hypothetical protein